VQKSGEVNKTSNKRINVLALFNPPLAFASLVRRDTSSQKTADAIFLLRSRSRKYHTTGRNLNPLSCSQEDIISVGKPY
jgi:hypothetical protein